MSKLHIEVDSATIKALVAEHLASKLGAVNVDYTRVVIQVQSKQNYRVHEWETGDFRAVYETEV
jgi:hypothetical protein